MSSLLYSSPIDGIVRLVRISLSPLISSLLLLAITYAPETAHKILDALADKLPGQFAPTPDFATAKMTLRILVILSLVRLLNRALNVLASNAWRLRSSRDWNWTDEVAVVTGGSSGIGRDIVGQLVALGVRVVVLDIQDLPKELQTNQRIAFYYCDVGSAESVAAAANAIRREHGHPSILINNAGVAKPVPILKIHESLLRKTFNVNCISLWFTTQQFLPRMVQLNKGHIVTVASVASFVALATAADYSATKAAALAFHESLACELKHCYKAPNVLTTVVHPNFVRTPLVKDFAELLERSGVRMLTSAQIASQVVTQIQSGKGGQLIIPKSVSAVSGIRGWPSWLQELLRDAVGRASVRQ